MSAEEEIPESVKSTLDAMQGREDPYGIQNSLSLFTVLVVASAWATLQLFEYHAHRDVLSVMRYIILFPVGWGVGISIIAMVVFRKSRGKNSFRSEVRPNGSADDGK